MTSADTGSFASLIAVYDYYGVDEYADHWVQSAFDGNMTKFTNGNANFSKYGFDGKEQAIKKGTAYMNAFMYVIREFEDALDICTESDNDGAVHAWDEGVVSCRCTQPCNHIYVLLLIHTKFFLLFSIASYSASTLVHLKERMVA